MSRVAIIGAGISGLTLATKLKDQCDIDIFEKSKGVSGRLATRYTKHFQFDHGAPFFSATSKDFKDFLKPFLDQGIVREWPAAQTENDNRTFVPAPKMNSLCKVLAEPFDIHTNTKVISIEHQNGKGWFVSTSYDEKHGPYDWVVSTAPAPQTHQLFEGHNPTFGNKLSQVQMRPRFTLMVGLVEPLKNLEPYNFYGGFIFDFIIVDSEKPGRDASYSLVAQTTCEWAEAHIDQDLTSVENILFKELFKQLKIDSEWIDFSDIQRWRYAITETPSNKPFFIDQDKSLAACGEWCSGKGVEGAFISAQDLATQLVGNN